VRAHPAPPLALVVVVAGALLALQARINGQLGQRLHSAIDAALVSFSVGTALLVVVVAVAHRDGLRRLRAGRVRWWWWLGGLAGAAVVASTAEGVPQVGVALVSVCIVAGTAVGALSVDAAGLGPGGRQRVTSLRFVGALLAVAAVALGALGDHSGSVRPALFIALFAAGAASGLQQAANGQVRRVAASTAVASVVSFAGGTVALVAVAALRGDLAGRTLPHPGWLYAGGALGAVYIAVAASAVERLGVLRVSLATVAGQLAGAVVLDVVWPAPGTHLHLTTILGAVLTLGAVGVVGIRRTSVAP
jgi:transporter family-2 protein